MNFEIIALGAIFVLLVVTGLLAVFSPERDFRHRYSALFFSVFLVLVGGTSNLIVVAANGGKMPVLVEAEDKETQTAVNESSKHIFLTAQTKFPMLADRIKLGATILSVGDIIMTLGLVMGIFLFLSSGKLGFQERN